MLSTKKVIIGSFNYVMIILLLVIQNKKYDNLFLNSFSVGKSLC